VTARFREQYYKEIRPALVKQFGLTNRHALGALEKISVNSCAGLAVRQGDKKVLEDIQRDMTLITGQKSIIVNAKRSVSNFKLRQGFPLAVMVTLRGDMMYEFLDRLITIALPRQRDFRGINPKSFDGRGNYALGIKEHTIFPEIDPDSVKHVFGMDINITTTCPTDDIAFALLKRFGLPFSRDKVAG
jgi:large subunit ribosomal protein L5